MDWNPVGFQPTSGDGREVDAAADLALALADGNNNFVSIYPAVSADPVPSASAYAAPAAIPRCF